MRIIVYSFAAIGFFISMLCLAGSLGIGNFRIYYGIDSISCFDPHTKQNYPEKRPSHRLKDST